MGLLSLLWHITIAYVMYSWLVLKVGTITVKEVSDSVGLDGIDCAAWLIGTEAACRLAVWLQHSASRLRNNRRLWLHVVIAGAATTARYMLFLNWVGEE